MTCLYPATSPYTNIIFQKTKEHAEYHLKRLSYYTEVMCTQITTDQITMVI